MDTSVCLPCKHQRHRLGLHGSQSREAGQGLLWLLRNTCLSLMDPLLPSPRWILGAVGPIITSSFLLPINANVFFVFFFSLVFFSSTPHPPYYACLAFWREAGWRWRRRVRRGKRRGWDSLLRWPAVCQLCASRMLSGVEKGLLAPTCTHSLSPFTPQMLALQNQADRFC